MYFIVHAAFVRIKLMMMMMMMIIIIIIIIIYIGTVFAWIRTLN